MSSDSSIVFSANLTKYVQTASGFDKALLLLKSTAEMVSFIGEQCLKSTAEFFKVLNECTKHLKIGISLFFLPNMINTIQKIKMLISGKLRKPNRTLEKIVSNIVKLVKEFCLFIKEMWKACSFLEAVRAIPIPTPVGAIIKIVMIGVSLLSEGLDIGLAIRSLVHRIAKLKISDIQNKAEKLLKNKADIVKLIKTIMKIAGTILSIVALFSCPLALLGASIALSIAVGILTFVELKFKKV